MHTTSLPGGSQEVFPLTPPLAALGGGAFWLRKDKCVRARVCVCVWGGGLLFAGDWLATG